MPDMSDEDEVPCRYIYLLPLLTYMYLSEVHVLYDFWPEAAMLPWRTEPGPVAVELVRQYARVPPTSFHYEGRSWQLNLRVTSTVLICLVCCCERQAIAPSTRHQ